MAFGLRNTAQTIHRFIKDIFRGHDHLDPYVDDCLIASSDKANIYETSGHSFWMTATIWSYDKYIEIPN